MMETLASCTSIQEPCQHPMPNRTPPELRCNPETPTDPPPPIQNTKTPFFSRPRHATAEADVWTVNEAGRLRRPTRAQSGSLVRPTLSGGQQVGHMNTSLRKSERSWSEAGRWGLDGWMGGWRSGWKMKGGRVVAKKKKQMENDRVKKYKN